MKCFPLVIAILLYTLPPTMAADGKVLEPLPKGPYAEARQIGNLTDPTLREVSGMAASRRSPDTLWVINDSGNGALLYAIGLNGRTRGIFHIQGIRNRDWEDLASFRIDGSAFLLVADIGDNNARQQECVMYIVEEPTIPQGQAPIRADLTPFRRIRFVYEDGPRDCEAVAVDLSSDKILLLSKRDPLPRLYALPLSPGGKDPTLTAHFLGEVSNIPPPSEEDLLEDPIFGRFTSQPTAMDIDPSGRVAIILTYKYAYRYERAMSETWETAFSRSPQILKLPKLKQAEALCLGYDGQTIFVTSERRPPSERRPAPLLRIDRINDRIRHPSRVE